MNITVKSWSILIVTLCLGMLIGTMLPFGPGHYGSKGGDCSFHGKYAEGRHGGKDYRHHKFKKKHWGGRHNPEWMLRKMERRLDLTDKQMDKIKPIFDTHSEKMRAAMSQAHDNMKALFRNFHNEIKPLLTEEQAEKMQKLMEKHGKKKWKRH